MNYGELARKVLESVGGEENIKSVTYCATRLRFVLIDDKKAEMKKIEYIDGVRGVFNSAGQYQIIIERGGADKAYNELVKITVLREKTVDEQKNSKQGFAGILCNMLNMVSNAAFVFLTLIIDFGAVKAFGIKKKKDKNIQKDDEMNEKIEKPSKLETELVQSTILSSPLKGRIIPLAKVKDKAFASGIMGKGAAIIPEEGKVCSPFDGTVSTLFNTNHAIGLVSNDGIEMLIHIGVDTVNLEGKYFKAYVNNGSRVKRGDVLVKFDIEKIKKAGYDITTCVLVTNEDEFRNVIPRKWERILIGEGFISVIQ